MSIENEELQAWQLETNELKTQIQQVMDLLKTNPQAAEIASLKADLATLQADHQNLRQETPDSKMAETKMATMQTQLQAAMDKLTQLESHPLLKNAAVPPVEKTAKQVRRWV